MPSDGPSGTNPPPDEAIVPATITDGDPTHDPGPTGGLGPTAGPDPTPDGDPTIDGNPAEALHDITASAYFSDPSTWPSLGYPGPVAI